MYKIEFDEKEHKYYVDGVLKPSVSQIIRNVIKNDEPIPEYAVNAMIRGTYVHKIINLWLLGRLDEESIDKTVIGYYKSFRKWYDTAGIKLELTEKILYNSDEDYCMTLDYSGVSELGYELIDFKTGQIYNTYGPQLGGYLNGYEQNYKKMVSNLSCLQLFKNGIIAKKHNYNTSECKQDWEAINRVYRIKKENK